MKKCKYCFEEIQDTAIKCRYCKEWLNETNEDNEKGQHLNENTKQKVIPTIEKKQEIPETYSSQESYLHIILTGGLIVILFLFTSLLDNIPWFLIFIGFGVLSFILDMLIDAFPKLKEISKIKNIDNIGTILGFLLYGIIVYFLAGPLFFMFLHFGITPNIFFILMPLVIIGLLFFSNIFESKTLFSEFGNKKNISISVKNEIQGLLMGLGISMILPIIIMIGLKIGPIDMTNNIKGSIQRVNNLYMLDTESKKEYRNKLKNTNIGGYSISHDIIAFFKNEKFFYEN